MFTMEVGTSAEVTRECIVFAHEHSFAYAAAGVHPSEVEELTDEKLEAVLGAFDTDEKVKGIGEIGLDYHYEDGPSRELQQYWFRRQLLWAIEHKAPVCIHSREADEDTMRILKECGAFGKERAACFSPKPDGSRDCRILLHCFSGSAELARQYTALGASISLGGPVTFKNARRSVEAAEAVKLQDLLIETDSPYMAPVPVRGTVNKPVNVELVAKKIAELKGISFEAAARATLENACRFYGIRL